MVTWTKIAQGTAATLSDSTPGSVGTAGAAGTAETSSRSDHVHDLGADCIDSGDLVADDVINAEHIGALTADIDLNGHSATNQVVENSSSPPASPALGMVYYDTDEDQLYVCTDASA